MFVIWREDVTRRRGGISRRRDRVYISVRIIHRIGICMFRREHRNKYDLVLLESHDDGGPGHWRYAGSAGWTADDDVDGEVDAWARDWVEFSGEDWVGEVEGLLVVFSRSHVNHFVVQTVCENIWTLSLACNRGRGSWWWRWHAKHKSPTRLS